MTKVINPELLCMGCMCERENLQGPCPSCGFDEDALSGPSYHLPCRSILNGKYLVGRVLGEGGFGITYLGWDLNLDMKVAIKEYYPSGLVTRQAPGISEVVNYGGEKEVYFDSGKNKFMEEAKILARFYALPGIVSVKDFFTESNTSYIVMEYLDGVTLKDYLKTQGGRIPAQVIMNWMRPVIHSMARVHKEGLIHRDISPDNIMLTTESGIKLLDFGSARDISPNGEKSLSVLLKPGYAPEEQYRSHGEQGAWTDVYALCATIYKCITGKTPPEPLERMFEDNLLPPSKLGADINERQERAVLKGLALRAEDRYQSMGELEEALYGGGEEIIEEIDIPDIPAKLPYKSVVLEKAEVKAEIKDEEVKKEDAPWEELHKVNTAYKSEVVTGSKTHIHLKKKVVLVSAIAVFAVLCIVLTMIHPEPDNIYGNSPCNILNGGRAVKASADKYFYAAYQQTGRVAGIRTENGFSELYSSEPVTDVFGIYLSVWEDFLYYLADDNCLYRTAFNGEDNTRILDNCMFYQIIDGRIYFIDSYKNLYSTDLFGRGKTKLAASAEFFGVTKGKVYYTERYRTSYKLYKEEKFIADLDTPYFVVDSDAIYALKVDAGNKKYGFYLEIISLDGQKHERTDIFLQYEMFNMTDSKIYFANAEDNRKLYRANKDGTQIEKVSDLSIVRIYVFSNESNGGTEDILCLTHDNKWYNCNNSYSDQEPIFQMEL